MAEIPEIIKGWKFERGTFKAIITNFRKFIEKCKQETVDNKRIQTRSEQFKDTHKPFSRIQDYLDVTNEKNI
jgi:hypothetical protein